MDHPSKSAKRFGASALAVIAVALVLAGIPATGSGQATAQNKVDRFLDLLLKANSLDQISRAYEGASFSAAEAKRIETEVAKPAYQAKLAALKPKLPPVQPGKLEATKRAAPTKAAGASGAGPARPAEAKATPAKLPNAPRISSQEMQAITSTPGGGTGARISRVDPSTVRAGQALAASGTGFGRQRGSAEIILSGRRYICDLESWNDTSVRAVVPEYMTVVIGERGQAAVLWIKFAGRSQGPTFDIRLEPTPPDIPLPKTTGPMAEIVEMEISTYVELDGSRSLADTETFEILMGNRLANGWRIVSSRLERVSGSGSFEYIREPRVGTPELHQVIRLNSAAFSRLRVASRMVIRGPRGMDYY